MSTGVSDENIASIFTVEDYAKPCLEVYIGFLLGSPFSTEAGGGMISRNFVRLSPGLYSAMFLKMEISVVTAE
jgi:hypothetical protein